MVTNMTVNTTETAKSLLLMSEGTSIDVSQVKEITGTVCEIIEIITSTNFIGYGNQNLVLLENIDAENLAFIQQSTTGTITQI